MIARAWWATKTLVALLLLAVAILVPGLCVLLLFAYMEWNMVAGAVAGASLAVWLLLFISMGAAD